MEESIDRKADNKKKIERKSSRKVNLARADKCVLTGSGKHPAESPCRILSSRKPLFRRDLPERRKLMLNGYDRMTCIFKSRASIMVREQVSARRKILYRLPREF